MGRKRKKSVYRKASLKKIHHIQDLYKIINQLQIKQKTIKINISKDEYAVAENIFNDAKILFTKIIRKEKVLYTLRPPVMEDTSEDTWVIDEDFKKILRQDNLF